MARIRFNPNSNRSQGLKLLKEELRLRGHDVKEIKVRNSLYRPHPSDIIICWGVAKSHYPGELNGNAANAANKLKAFQMMTRNGLRWSVNKEEAKAWRLCYCRTLLSSSQGRGVVVAQRPEEVVDAPLYTKGIIEVEGEYRVHIFKGQVIDFAKKMKMSSNRLAEDGITHNPLIRNLHNGYIFGRENVSLSPEVERVALESIEDLGLDFGAVDLVLSSRSGKAFTLEVNTAAGISGTTVQSYASAIEQHLATIV